MYLNNTICKIVAVIFNVYNSYSFQYTLQRITRFKDENVKQKTKHCVYLKIKINLTSTRKNILHYKLKLRTKLRHFLFLFLFR